MYNYFMLMGKLVSLRKGSKDEYELDLAVTRPFAEVDGHHKTDYFTIQVPTVIAETLIEADLHEHKTISVKGRLTPVLVGTSAMLIAERIMWGD